MRIAFSGLDRPIDVADRGITMLQIESESLFARVCDSLISLKGEKAIEPYTVWTEEGGEVNPSGAFMVVVNPFDLPWKHKCMMGGLYSKLENELLIDDELRQEMIELGLALESSAHKLGFQLNANYRFGVEWNLSSYLKAFSYEVEVFDTASLLEKLISFIDLGADMSIDRVIVFINLKTFLAKNELTELQDRLFFHGIRALLLERYSSSWDEECVRKYLVDRDFVEYVFKGRSDCPSSSQGRICSNGFGAVAI